MQPTGKRERRSSPKTVKVKGVPHITATIYRQERSKPDKEGKLQTYVSFITSYVLQGKRRMEAHKSLEDAQQAAAAAIGKIAEGKQAVLELSAGARER